MSQYVTNLGDKNEIEFYILHIVVDLGKVASAHSLW